MQWPAGFVVLVLTCLVAGCGGSDGTGIANRTGGADDSSRPAFNHGAPGAAVCSGADLSGVKTAVYVAAQGVDASGCGATTTASCKSLQQGIDQCTASGCAVLVRHGLYPTSATIQLKNGVSVYGGCRFDGEPDRKYRTTLQASPLPPGTPAIGADTIDSATTVHGLVVIGKDETAAGSPSIAMAVSNSRGLTLARSVLVAGKGGDGTAGAPLQAQPGGEGQSPTCFPCRGAGGAACPSNPPPAGVGKGGDGAARNKFYSYQCIGRCRCEQQFPEDRLGLKGQDSGTAAGGGGGSEGAIGCSCYGAEATRSAGVGAGDPGLEDPGSGNPGKPPADDGACSAQGGSASGLTWGLPGARGAFWHAGVGGVGAPGSVGAGGGGGGAGGFSTASGNDQDGLGGGGGGGGGCGGPGGPGGQQGGASLALVLVDSALVPAASANSIVAGPGGRGGKGGAGAAGGAGGNGGAGTRLSRIPFDIWGTCHTTLTPAWGGDGGPGGKGGAGSGGAGGDGGPSIGIALSGGSPVPDSSAGIFPGPAGPGGDHGDAGVNPKCNGVTGASGSAGGAAAVVDLNKPPSLARVALPAR